MAHEQAANLIEAWLRYPVQALTTEILKAPSLVLACNAEAAAEARRPPSDVSAIS